MATITVSFEGGDIKMSDKGKTKASRSEIIHWHPGDNVFEITKVFAKPDSPITTANFWSNAPIANGKSFKGTINGTVVGSWVYNIECNVGTKQNPVLLEIDPLIQVES